MNHVIYCDTTLQYAKAWVTNMIRDKYGRVQ